MTRRLHRGVNVIPLASVTGLEVLVVRIPYRVWFPAHWAPVVLQQLQQKEDNYRADNPSWMDQEEASIW